MGGIIPTQDIAELKEMGVAEVFLPGLVHRRTWSGSIQAAVAAA